jgi:hypothetical protein
MLRRSMLPQVLVQFPLIHGWFIRRKFGIELALLRGDHHTTNSHRSIIHFSVNKAATQYVKSILRRSAMENGMTHVQINEYAFDSDLPFLDHLSIQEMREYQHIFKPFGYLYSVFGGMVEGIPNFVDYLVVLMVRDPRDVLTSDYFSIGYSHRLPGSRKKNELFREERGFARRVSIDEYAIRGSEQLRQTYQRYLDLLVDNPNVHITTYEDMIVDFPMWLDTLLDYCQLTISSQLKRELLEEARMSRPREENPSRHMRQVTPGDHQRKLQQDTIAQLDTLFSSILRRFMYV